MRRWVSGAAALVWAAVAGSAYAQARPEILTGDVERFFAVYDAAGGRPSAEALERDYLAHGSPGLRHFAEVRRVTGARIAERLAKEPQIYENARRCVAVLPGVKRRLARAFDRLAGLYPQAQFPPVTLVVGRGRPVGIADETGVIMGLEALCAADFMHPDLEDRFVHTIAHEYGHVQQPAWVHKLDVGDPQMTLLRAALTEGAAEFVAELISGAPGNHQHRAWTRGREAEIEQAFVREQDSTELSNWLFNGPGTAQAPGDLAYWVGHRIVKAYYDRARDKRAALRAIFEMKDPRAFLAESGWRPAS